MPTEETVRIYLKQQTPHSKMIFILKTKCQSKVSVG